MSVAENETMAMEQNPGNAPAKTVPVEKTAPVPQALSLAKLYVEKLYEEKLYEEAGSSLAMGQHELNGNIGDLNWARLTFIVQANRFFTAFSHVTHRHLAIPGYKLCGQALPILVYAPRTLINLYALAMATSQGRQAFLQELAIRSYQLLNDIVWLSVSCFTAFAPISKALSGSLTSSLYGFDFVLALARFVIENGKIQGIKDELSRRKSNLSNKTEANTELAAAIDKAIKSLELQVKKLQANVGTTAVLGIGMLLCSPLFAGVPVVAAVGASIIVLTCFTQPIVKRLLEQSHAQDEKTWTAFFSILGGLLAQFAPFLVLAIASSIVSAALLLSPVGHAALIVTVLTIVANLVISPAALYICRQFDTHSQASTPAEVEANKENATLPRSDSEDSMSDTLSSSGSFLRSEAEGSAALLRSDSGDSSDSEDSMLGTLSSLGSSWEVEEEVPTSKIVAARHTKSPNTSATGPRWSMFSRTEKPQTKEPQNDTLTLLAQLGNGVTSTPFS